MLPGERSRPGTCKLCSIAAVCLLVALPALFQQYNRVVANEINRDKDSEARLEMEQAERLRQEGSAASLRQAIEKFEKASLIWTTARDFSNASHAALQAGDVYFLLSEYPDALKQYRKAATLAERTRDKLAHGRALSHMGRLYSYTGDNDRAQNELTKALDLLKHDETDASPAHRNAYAEALSNLAEVNYAKGHLPKALAQFERARPLFRDDRTGQAKTHLFAGYIAGSLGELDKAAAAISRAQELYRATNDKPGEGLTLTAQGLFHSSKGDEDLARQLHNQALEIFRSSGDRHSEAIALTALGQSYERVNEHSLALDHYERAVNIFQAIGALDFVPMATCKVATAHRFMGDFDRALAVYNRCVDFSRAAGKVRTEIIALKEIANVHTSQKRPELASRLYRKVQRFYESSGDLRGQALVLNAYADFLYAHEQKRQALPLYLRALAFSEKVGDGVHLLEPLYNVARAHRDLGAYTDALSVIKRSLKVIEDLRANVGSPDVRAIYFSGVAKHYSLAIDIFMQLDRERPAQGFAAEALLLSEQARARSLVDLLSESGLNLRSGAPAQLLQRERELRGLIRLLAQYQWDLSLSKRNTTEIEEVAKDMAQLRSEYENIQSQLREQFPHVLTPERLPILTLQQLQKELLDSNTMLLEYALGDERSYLWAVTPDSFFSYELPEGKKLEDAAREFYKLLIARQGSQGQTASEYQKHVQAADDLLDARAFSLSQMLLGPVAEQLGNRRLIVVSQGALQFVPFEVLPAPVPQSAGPIESAPRSRLILETNEVVGLPSISTLATIRSLKKQVRSPGRVVAVIADPVYSQKDERVQREDVSGVDPNAIASTQPAFQALLRSSGDVRLIHAAKEADAISASAPGGATLIAKGFDASRETAMSPNMGEFQIVHFATHGFLDNEHPELSGIVLTMVDRNGVAKDGVMTLHDIYSLDLSAELAVLSACQTALGKEVRGEGLVGLTHSFMSAGAKSVVASLWKVDDRATAVLMEDFYRSMLQEGMTPAAALRAAKLKMMRDKQWSAPYYWAGFVLQGEYTNRIVVDTPSPFRRGLGLLLLLILFASGLLIFLRMRRSSVQRRS